MADYLPLYHISSCTFTSTASGTITGGQLLVVSGDGTVATAGASAANVIGVAGCDAVANGLVTVYGFGPVHSTVNSGGVTAGQELISAASGQVATLAAAAAGEAADVNNARKRLGVALTTASTGVACQWIQC